MQAIQSDESEVEQRESHVAPIPADTDGEELQSDKNSDVGDDCIELDALLDPEIASATRAGHATVIETSSSTIAVASQRERLLRLGGTSPLHKQHARQQRLEQAQDEKWAPTQLPELLATTSNATLERFHAHKWRELHQLFLLLQAPCFRAVRLAGNDRALFETFSRAFPHDMVPKARFTSVLRAALGIRHDVDDVRAAKHASERLGDLQQRADHLALCRHLDRLRYSCERGANNVPMLHWRTLLVALRMFQEPLLPMREQLAWAFSAFASVNGYLELRASSDAEGKSGGTVAVGDVFLLFTHALRSPAAAAFVSDRLRAALAMAPLALPVLHAANVSQQLQRLLGPSASRISRAEFRALLRLPPLRSLLRPGATGDAAITSVGAKADSLATATTPARLTSPHTCALDELCSAVYRAHVFSARRREHNVRAIQRLRYYTATRALRACFAQWATLAHRQASARARLVVVSSAVASKRSRRAFGVWKVFSIASIAAIEVQRVFRGFRGRRAWLEQWQRVQAALKVQGAFRMRAHLTRFLRELRRRHAMAVRLQRVFRGRQGRVAARQALVALYYREMLALRLERQAFYARIRDAMAARIQRALRRWLRERLALRRRQEALACRAIEREMQDHVEQAQRDLRRRRLDVAAEYERARVEHERREQRRKVDALEKQKIVRRRRQRAWDALRADRVERRERLKKAAEDAYTALKREWDARVEDRARARQALVAQLLSLDDEDARSLSDEWRALRLELKPRVKARARELAAKFKVAKAAVPKREVDERARDEVAVQEADAARQATTSEWLQAEETFLRRLDDEAEQRSLAENAQQQVAREQSAVRVQSAFRMFAARKQLRDAVRARVVKEFDPRTRQAVYRNTFTGEASERKPPALGSVELPFPDQWLVLRDDVTGDAFFYNPQSMRQSWDPPEECRLCERGSASEGQLVTYDGSRRDGVAA